MIKQTEYRDHWIQVDITLDGVAIRKGNANSNVRYQDEDKAVTVNIARVYVIEDNVHTFVNSVELSDTELLTNLDAIESKLILQAEQYIDKKLSGRLYKLTEYLKSIGYV